jgi:hypothetical protein
MMSSRGVVKSFMALGKEKSKASIVLTVGKQAWRIRVLTSRCCLAAISWEARM